MPRLRWPPTFDRRGHERDARLGSGAASCLAHSSPQIRLPRLRHDPSGAGPRPRHRQGPGHAGADRPGAGQQVLRPHAALSPGPDPRPPRRPDRTLDPGGLGRRRLLVAGAAAGSACRPCLCVDQAVRPFDAACGVAQDRLDTPLPVLDPGPVNPRGGAGPRPGGSGSMRATTAPGPDRIRRLPSTSTAPTARRCGQRLISKTSRACCRSMAMPGSRHSR